MSTTSPRSPPTRRPSSHASPTANSIAKGATARSAVSPKVNASLNGATRRPVSRGSSLAVNVAASDSDGMPHDTLVAALKTETEEKEGIQLSQLIVRLQNKDQSITTLTTENDNLTSALNAAESRLSELYADQSRIEEEMATRLDLVDRLRAQIQELEKENRDVVRRYNEQTATFDAERQSFYDNEQHLKSRIQSLTQARKLAYRPPSPAGDAEGDLSFSEVEDEAVTSGESLKLVEPSSPSKDDEDNEPAEMTSLRLELSTLSTSYSSLQTTVQHLSSQLLDLKRVNAQLQEENEGYNILLREKTLNGQFDILRTVGTGDSDDESDDDDLDRDRRTDGASLRSTEKSFLDPVDETAEDMDPALTNSDLAPNRDDTDSLSSIPERSRRFGRGRRTGTSSPQSRQSPTPRGESLADLPITGPGLDLAAELGRAENQAILEGRIDPTESQQSPPRIRKPKKDKKVSLPFDTGRKGEHTASGGDLDALRTEVKSLKDANKALSLYASKIIDRIIAQEGFEHVLAVDYDVTPDPGSPAKPKTPNRSTRSPEGSPQKKPRPQSAIFARPTASPEPIEKPSSSSALSSERTSTSKPQRRSMSFDWKNFSMFGGLGEKKADPNANLRPLTLRPGTSSVVGARKLETHEDENDRMERERMNATLKLMGIEKPESAPSPVMRSLSSPADTLPSSTPIASKPPVETSRFPFFRSRSAPSDETSETPSSVNKSNLTEEALERSEAESSLAALDAREQVLRAEIAKGSNGGFTELPKRRRLGEEWRSKKSGGSGSGSTVFSAGMHEDGD
ncbi:hypothetical protein BD410DRAFT_798683 [Rickenella mellea]|uniref:M protein, serotype 2.1 n=1 Tax=Rickenella mellea TaxID=50990 RepID=A0A4Y7QLZ0_9AGAM|nr:hypothetical protein BD410DRAFT_798683 [Rickenella mellea]